MSRLPTTAKAGVTDNRKSAGPTLTEGAERGPSQDPTTWTLKMKGLCDAVSMTRQSVHFYIKEGLIPPGRKRGRNMAFYGQLHIDRLLLIRQLQEERFMPLAAIRALIEGRDHHFSPSQHGWLAEIREVLPEPLRPASTSGAQVVLTEADVLERYGIQRDELQAFYDEGLIAARTDDAGKLHVAASDVWMLELWAEARDSGLVGLGLTIANLVVYHDAISQLFAHETALFARLMSGLDAPAAAKNVAAGLDLGNRLLIGLHRAKLTQFLSISAQDSSPAL